MVLSHMSFICLSLLYVFHTRSDKPGVKDIIEMHRFNICLVVVLLWCESTITLGLIAIIFSIKYYCLLSIVIVTVLNSCLWYVHVG